MSAGRARESGLELELKRVAATGPFQCQNSDRRLLGDWWSDGRAERSRSVPAWASGRAERSLFCLPASTLSAQLLIHTSSYPTPSLPPLAPLGPLLPPNHRMSACTISAAMINAPAARASMVRGSRAFISCPAPLRAAAAAAPVRAARRAAVQTRALFGGGAATKDSIYDYTVKVRCGCRGCGRCSATECLPPLPWRPHAGLRRAFVASTGRSCLTPTAQAGH